MLFARAYTAAGVHNRVMSFVPYRQILEAHLGHTKNITLSTLPRCYWQPRHNLFSVVILLGL
jgi:hypothetical protein